MKTITTSNKKPSWKDWFFPPGPSGSTAPLLRDVVVFGLGLIFFLLFLRAEIRQDIIEDKLLENTYIMCVSLGSMDKAANFFCKEAKDNIIF